ncbi:hypothetical protein CAC42_4349 [Sphaceloma murrayae]|uniref:Imitation switch two complex protein 1 n=1 Tax=Sphaceloma murrayae TaxID=2082308 RepID=A0A2K1QLB2_9PEZI|nr:hypothetical protein CAC42_4349 [Sphaceloma murrayae]
MVLYKRKPIAYVEPPSNLHGETEVWTMRGSDEVFTSYDSYLERFDYYSQRNFTDAVNGRSNMTFFEALESENTSSGDIERTFPEALRAPILRKVQFSEIGRMDDLVSYVYEEFRNDFFPGEEVTLVMDDGESMEGTIREKANFPELRNPDGSVQRPAFSRYFVKIRDSNEEALLDGPHMKRGRNIFTKANIKSYLKNCMWRDAWIGAPWLVKEQLAIHYRLPMAIPAHLTQEAKNAQNKLMLAQQRDSPATKVKKTKIAGPKPFSVDQWNLHESDPMLKEDLGRHENTRQAIDDLDLSPSNGGQKRPRLKFLAPLDGTAGEGGLRMDSMGPLLETWNALNVHWDVYELDAFTFDDFVDAMKFSSPNVTCELIDEVHCAILKLLVNKEGDVEVDLPEMEDETTEEDESMADDSVPATPVEPPARRGRSRLSEVQNASDHPTLNDGPRHSHRAVEMLAERDWIARLTARDLSEGGWQIILVGLLHQLSLSPLYSSRVEPILHHLASPDLPPTQHSARTQYTTLDVNHRVTALSLLTQLSLSTPYIRHNLDRRSEEMTVIRKQKVETQRERKVHLAEVNSLELDRRANNPDAFLDEEEVKKEEIDTPVLANGHAPATSNGKHVDDSLSVNGDDEEEDLRPASVRRANQSRKRKRDEELARKENERLATLEKQKDKADKVKKYKRILRDIDAAKKKVADCEARIEGFDEKLREMNNARMRSLGRDRFWGRWWWFERVGMSMDGRRGKKGSEEGYANGRLWCQGPLEMERIGFVEMCEADEKGYVARHGVSVVQRKRDEEEGEGVRTAEQWGYFDTAEEVDGLIAWLEEKGRREKDLKKELVAWRDDIVGQMEQMQEILHPLEEVEAEEEAKREVRTRVSTRNKTYLDEGDVEKHWRCLRWRNTKAGKTGRHCVNKDRKGPTITMGKRGQKQAHLDEERNRAVSSRSGAGGKGIAIRVPSGRAKKVLKETSEEVETEDKTVERGLNGRPMRSTRGKRGRFADEDEDEVDELALEEPRATRRSTRNR